MCENDSSCPTLSQLETDESWLCCPGILLSHQGRKSLIDGITWSFSTFGLVVPRLDQLKQPQIIILQLADFKGNDHFFWGWAVYIVVDVFVK